MGWLDHLIGRSTTLDALMLLAHAMSEQTVALRERAAGVAETIVGLLAKDPSDRSEFLNLRASALNNLGNRLSALGQREDAAAATQEAVELCRALTADSGRGR